MNSVPTLIDKKPLEDFMYLLDNKGDIRVLYSRFINGLDRIEAENLYSYDQSEDERITIQRQLLTMKKMIRDSHSGRKARPELVAKMMAEYRVRREIEFEPDTTMEQQVIYKAFIPLQLLIILIICLFACMKRK